MKDLSGRLAEHGLRISGVALPVPADGLPDWVAAITLVSPLEPAFWSIYSTSAEATDGLADPVDRWSRRIIGRLACDFDAKAYFPFGGPPHRPFYSWAIRSGSACSSPVSLLADGVAGLFVSYRGALALRHVPEVDLPAAPCSTCETKPCLSACPANALGSSGYDVPVCHSFLDTADGKDCLASGCMTRRACPIGKANRPTAMSAYFMSQFHK